jgi:hypothetical protein
MSKALEVILNHLTKKQARAESEEAVSNARTYMAGVDTEAINQNPLLMNDLSRGK